MPWCDQNPVNVATERARSNWGCCSFLLKQRS
jgi:hypothetical protein